MNIVELLSSRHEVAFSKWTPAEWGALAAALIGLAIALVSRAAQAALRRSLSQEFDPLRERIRALAQAVQDSRNSPVNPIAEVIEAKKEAFSNITSISFHFVDKEEVENFYQDTFQEPTIESLVAEVVEQSGRELKAGIPKTIESKIGAKDLSKWISTIKLPASSLSSMFARYQRETIRRNEVTLGMEELDIELNDLQRFQASIDNLRTQFGFKVDHDAAEIHKTKLKQDAAETMLRKLEDASGWILMEGLFRIELAGGMYRCTYIHPVNEYLSEGIGPIAICFTLQKELIESKYAANYAQSLGKLIPLRLYGKVWHPVDRNTHTWHLEITPLAVY